MANSIDVRLTALADRLEAAETKINKLTGTVTAHGVALKDKDK